MQTINCCQISFVVSRVDSSSRDCEEGPRSILHTGKAWQRLLVPNTGPGNAIISVV